MANESLRNTEKNLIANIAMYLNGFTVDPNEVSTESSKVLSTYTPHTFLQSNNHILSAFDIKTAYSSHDDNVRVTFETQDKKLELEFNKTANTVNCRYG